MQNCNKNDILPAIFPVFNDNRTLFKLNSADLTNRKVIHLQKKNAIFIKKRSV